MGKIFWALPTAAIIGIGCAHEKSYNPPIQVTREPVFQEDLPVPFYPSSKELPGGILIEENNKKAVTSIRQINDTVERIFGFYESKIGKAERINKSEMGGEGHWVNGSATTDIKVISQKGIATITLRYEAPL